MRFVSWDNLLDLFFCNGFSWFLGGKKKKMTHKSRLVSLNESIKCFLLSNGCILSVSGSLGSQGATVGWRSSPR